MPTVSIKKWNTGITNDPRDTGEGVCRMSTNFDILTSPHKLVPYRNSNDFDSSSSTSRKQNFAVALRTGITYSLYALGVKSGAATAEVLYKNFGTGSATDFDDATWASPSANESGSGITSFNLFTYYKKTGLIYGARAGTHIWAFSPTGTAWADTSHALTYTNISEGLVHSKDDIMYVPYDNNIASNNNGSWNDTAITIPEHLYITSIAEYGNYIAIGASPLSGVGKAVVYLWDRDTSLTTLSESIQWGDGLIKVLAEVDGQLVGISQAGANEQRFTPKITFRYLIGNRARTFNEFISESVGDVASSKQIIDNRLYFMMNLTLNGTLRQGVWSIGYDDDSAGFTFAHERTPENDTVIDSTTPGSLISFIITGDYMIQAYKDVTPDWAVSSTDFSEGYSATSIRETTINPHMKAEDRTKDKTLEAVSVSYTPLASWGQVVLKYRVDAETAWSSAQIIFTETTNATITTEAVIDADGDQFKSGREYEFRLESTGGVEITELKYKYAINDSQI